MIVARVPELWIKRLLGSAKGDMHVAPQRVQAGGIAAGCVRPRSQSVDQIGDDGTLGDQLR